MKRESAGKMTSDVKALGESTAATENELNATITSGAVRQWRKKGMEVKFFLRGMPVHNVLVRA